MRLAAAAVCAALVLAACGGDPKPSARPSASGTPSPSAFVPPAAQRLRDAVAKALADCPCTIDVEATISGDKPRTLTTATLTGYHDPATQASSLAFTDDPSSTIKIIEGRTFLSTADLRKRGQEWALLDFQGVPASPKATVLTLLAAVDPAFAFAVGRAVVEEPETFTSGQRESNKVEYDITTAQPLTGGGGAVFARLVSPSVSLGHITLMNGAVSQIRYDVVGRSADVNDTAHVTLTIRKSGLPAQTVSIPRISGTIDVTKV